MKSFKSLFLLSLALLTASISFGQAIRSNSFQLLLQFDDRPDQISWELTAGGRSIRSGGPYATGNANKLVSISLDEFTFGEGATFTFTLKDSGNDGLNGGAWAINSGNQLFSSRTVGTTIVNGETGFGSQTSVTFSNTDRTTTASGPNTIGTVSLNDFSPVVIEATSTPQPNPEQEPETQPEPEIVNDAGLSKLFNVNLSNGVVELNFLAENSGEARLEVFSAFNGRGLLSRLLDVNPGRNTFTISGRPGTRLIATLTDLATGKVIRSRGFRL